MFSFYSSETKKWEKVDMKKSLSIPQCTWFKSFYVCPSVLDSSASVKDGNRPLIWKM